MIHPRTPGDARAAAIMQDVDARPADPAALRAALAEVEAIADAGPVTFIVRGQILGDLGRAADAAKALEQAVALAPDSADAQYSLGLAYADLGRHADALAAWQAAVRADPTHRDANYNAGQALYNLGGFEQALAHWRRGLELAPDDFFVLKKVVQAENALGLDAAATRARLLEVWRTSADPDVRRQQSFVFDQFTAGGWRVMSVELLGDPLPADADVMRFVVEDRPDHLAFTIRIETSAYARSRGTPFVVSVSDATEYKVVDSYKELPPYHDLRGRVRRLLESIRPGTA